MGAGKYVAKTAAKGAFKGAVAGTPYAFRGLVWSYRSLVTFGSYIAMSRWGRISGAAVLLLMLLDASWGSDGMGFPIIGWPFALILMLAAGGFLRSREQKIRKMIYETVRAAVPGYTRADDVGISFGSAPLTRFTFHVPPAMQVDSEEDTESHLRSRLPVAKGSSWDFEWRYQEHACTATIIPALATKWHPYADGSFGTPLAPIGDATKVPLGITFRDRELVWDCVESAHMFVVGATGGGKSVLLNGMIEHFLLHRNDWAMYLIDLKRTEFSEFRDYPGVALDVATTHLTACAVLEKAAREMDERQTLLDLYRVKDLAELNQVRAKRGESHLKHIVVVIDEVESLMQKVTGKSEEMEERREARDRMESLMDLISMLGRAMGIHLVYATQRTRAEIVSMTTRSNTQTRIGVGKLDMTQSQMVFEKNIASKMRGGKGRGYLYESGKITEIQTYRIEMPQIRQMIGVRAAESHN